MDVAYMKQLKTHELLATTSSTGKCKEDNNKVGSELRMRTLRFRHDREDCLCVISERLE